MTPLTCMEGKTLAILGLGVSGLATARALTAGGATPICFDDAPAKVDQAAAEGFATQDPRRTDWSTIAALVLSPGVPLTHPKPHWTVELAKAAGVAVIGDVELFCRQRREIAPDSPFIAVTGTNGKSTTTALIAHILREVGCDAQTGGNIGTPILALAPPASNRLHVVEMSSFQIDLTPSLAPSIGVLLNITPDHLDRHGTMGNYAAIKARVVKNAELAVIGVDDEFSRAIFDRAQQAKIPALAISAKHASPIACTYFEDGCLRRQLSLGDRGCLEENLLDLSGVNSLRGAHNGQNAAAAFCVCDWLAIPHNVIGTALRGFPGLPHRLEEVGRAGGVIFINDSKATNADSAEKALLSFDGGIFWILGGKPKEGGIGSLKPLFGRVEKAYIIGAATEEFAAALAEDGVAHQRCGTLDAALDHAARDASMSRALAPVVLLSPACASYDQFRNFEERGDRFRALAQALNGKAATVPQKESAPPDLPTAVSDPHKVVARSTTPFQGEAGRRRSSSPIRTIMPKEP
jgi:UDP-N-acetylmuramoylalanine--D-glutamate ligase